MYKPPALILHAKSNLQKRGPEPPEPNGGKNVPGHDGPVDVNEVQKERSIAILHFFALQAKLPLLATSSMTSLSFLVALFALLSTVSAVDTRVRSLVDATASSSGVPVAAVAGVAAAAAVAVVLLVTMKVRSDRRPAELHEIVISPSQPAAQPLSTKKQFVYTAHI
ncbi:hypothetical protein PRNP1_010438 [Phytophthora ramorum]